MMPENIGSTEFQQISSAPKKANFKACQDEAARQNMYCSPITNPVGIDLKRALCTTHDQWCMKTPLNATHGQNFKRFGTAIGFGILGLIAGLVLTFLPALIFPADSSISTAFVMFGMFSIFPLIIVGVWYGGWVFSRRQICMEKFTIETAADSIDADKKKYNLKWIHKIVQKGKGYYCEWEND